MGRGEIVFSRRGMSPLIATVLLMAFAVALGGMIMNLKVNIGVNDECSQLSQTISVTQFCLEGENIVLKAKSSEEAPPVQSVRVSIVTGDIEKILNVRNSAMGPNEELRLAIPESIGGTASVELVGVVGPKGKPFVCSEAPIERVDPINPC